MYGVVLEAFPAALLEDPHELPDVEALLEPVRDRVSFDAPIHRVADIGLDADDQRQAVADRRPASRCSRSTSTAPRNGVAMYGGGMGELGVGRGQIELLASLFHPDAPNDVAPSAFNAEALADGLPASPLVLDEPAPGFRWGYEA